MVIGYSVMLRLFNIGDYTLDVSVVDKKYSACRSDDAKFLDYSHEC